MPVLRKGRRLIEQGHPPATNGRQGGLYAQLAELQERDWSGSVERWGSPGHSLFCRCQRSFFQQRADQGGQWRGLSRIGKMAATVEDRSFMLVA